MKTERNQPASVGRHDIWSLSDALPGKEVFQSARFYRYGLKPILAETLHRFISQQSDTPMSGDESSYGMFLRKGFIKSANHCIW